MKKYKELSINHPENELVSLLSRMKNDKQSIFEYRSIITNGYARSTFQNTDHVGMFKSKRKSYFESMVWVLIEDNVLKVVNIVPSTCSKLGIDQYNRILLSFYNDFIAKHIDDTWDSSVHISEDEIGIDSMLTQRCFDSLRNWEESCDKSSPISNPNDEQRWMLYVSYLHKDKEECSFSYSDLKQWLIEDKKWPSGFHEQIEELVINLEYSLTLLDYYDRIQG